MTKHGQARTDHALELIRNGQAGEARDVLVAVEQEEGLSDEGRSWLLLARVDSGDYEEALTGLERICWPDPSIAEWVVLALVRTKRWCELESLLEQAEALRFFRKNASHALAWAHSVLAREQGNVEESTQWESKARALAKDIGPEGVPRIPELV